MLTAIQPDLPTTPPDTPVGGGSVIERVSNLEASIKAMAEDRRRLLEAMRGMWDTLNQDGVLDIVQARINGTNIGDVAAGTGSFTTLAVATSSTFPSGSITPGVSFGGGTTGITYSSQTGSRMYVGGWVFCSGIFVLTNKGSSTGSAVITGLPVAVRNNNDSLAAVALEAANLTFTGQLQGKTVVNTTTIALSQTTEAGTFSALTDANFSNTTQITFALLYRAS